MEAKVQCVSCEKWLTLDEVKYAYEDDDPYCEKCLDRAEMRAEAYWEAYHEDQNVDRAREEM